MSKNLFFSVTIFTCNILFFILCLSNTSYANNTIISFGDSITQGLWEIQFAPNGARVGGFQPVLEKLTDSIGNHHDVLNYGLGGETTLEGLKRLPAILGRHPSSDYILILEGTNDLWSGISRTATAWNLGLMVDRARENNITPVLGTLTPDTRPGVGEYKNIPAYNILIRDLALSKKVALVDFYTEMVELWNSLYADGQDHNNGKGIDYLHPGSEGYKKMAELWFKTLFRTDKAIGATLLLLLGR